MSYLKVISRKQSNVVGAILPRVGMLTNEGPISKVTKAGTVFVGDQQYRKTEGLSVRHTEALKFGYPHAEGSIRHVSVNIRRGTEVITA
jgi:hypothetical protein